MIPQLPFSRGRSARRAVLHFSAAACLCILGDGRAAPGVCVVTSNQQKILQYHIGRLKDRQREVRLASIRELEDMGDPAALASLQAVFDSDTDVEVRRAAQAAGRSIFLRSRSRKP